MFYPGRRYIGAAETPFFVSEDMLRDEAADRGFAEVQIWDAEAFGPLPFARGGEPDVIASGRFVGKAPKAMDLPDDVLWVFDVTGSEGLPAPGGPPTAIEPVAQRPPLSSSGPRWWVIGAIMTATAAVAAGAFVLAERTT